MIKIIKSSIIPKILDPLNSKGKGKTATDDVCNKYSLSYIGDQINEPKEKFKFYSDIYGDEKVKEQLTKDQFGKCCYCESKIRKIIMVEDEEIEIKEYRTDYGNVEHFRPKGKYKNEETDKFEYPGYYWLAYDWDNLLLSCHVCNISYKKNHFPVLTESNRVKSHLDNRKLFDESPMLVNPTIDNPEEFFDYRKGVIFGKDALGRGKRSIEIYGLKRFNEDRDRRYMDVLGVVSLKHPLYKLNTKDLSSLNEFFKRYDEYVTIESFLEIVNHHKKIYDVAAKSDSEFAGMIRANFPDLPRD